MNDADRILEELTKVSIKILLKEPFYSHIFACLNKEVVTADHRLSTLAVGLYEFNHIIYINRDFWDNFLTSTDHRYGVVKHEILHIVLKHTLADLRAKNKHVANIAMDIVVNQYVLRENLPNESIFMDKFPDLDLEAEESWQYYYKKIMLLHENEDGKFDNTISLENFNKIEEDSHGLERHVFWSDFKELTSSDKHLTENILDNLLILGQNKTPVSSYGKLPGRVKQSLDSLKRKELPLVNWKKVLKLFAESSAKTKIKNTIKRKSKRYGTFPGIKIRRLKKLLVAIDTSGSVSIEEIALFFSEIYHIWRSGAEIRVVECDTQISREYDYKGITPSFVTGRGGTDFNAPIEYGNDEYSPDALVYFTDGYAPIPVIKSRHPILWVFTKNGISPKNELFKKFPGRKAKF